MTKCSSIVGDLKSEAVAYTSIFKKQKYIVSDLAGVEYKNHMTNVVVLLVNILHKNRIVSDVKL